MDAINWNFLQKKKEEKEGGHTSLGESVKGVSSFIISAKVPTARVYFASILGEDCIVQTILVQVYKLSLCQVWIHLLVIFYI